MNIIKKIIASILATVLLMSVCAVSSGAATTNKNQSISIKTQCLYDEAFEMLSQINALRKAKGIPQLNMNSTLLSNAMQRGAEIVVDFDHTRPDGSQFFTVNANQEIRAENIGYAYKNATDAVNGFKESTYHNTNMMNKDYTSVGIGAVEHNGVRYWVQLFGQHKSGFVTTAQSNSEKAFNIALGNNTFELSVSVSDKVFVTDVEPLRVMGKNKTQNAYFYLNSDSLTYTSSDPSIVSMNSNSATMHKNGSATITIKNSAVTLTKTLKVETFAQGESNKCGDDVYFQYNNGTLTFSGSGDMYDYCTVYDKEGTMISTNLPYQDGFGCVDTVVVEEGITSLSDSAFTFFDKLESVKLPSTLKTIGDNAFAFCGKLKSVVIPDSVVSLGIDTFRKCSSLDTLTLSDNLSEIPSGMLYSCSSIRNIDIPDTVTTIGQSAFAYCTSLEALDLPQSLESIDKLAFINCSKIKTVSLPYNLNSIGRKAFSDCTALVQATVNNPVTTFDENVFLNTASSFKVIGYDKSSAQKYCVTNNHTFKKLSATELVVQAKGFECEYTGESVSNDILINVDTTDDYSVSYSKGKSFDYTTNFDSIESLSTYYREEITYDERIDGYLMDCGTYPVSYCVYSEGYVPYTGCVDITITKSQPKFYFEQAQGEMFYYKGGDNTKGFSNTIVNRGSIEDVDLSFTTDNSDIVVVDWHGKAIAKNFGECTITATFSGNENYYAHSATYKLTIYPVGKFKIDVYTYEFFEDMTASVSLYQGSLSDVSVPTDIMGYKLTTIKEKAFYSRGFETLNIPNSIKKIENKAFVSSYSLDKLTLGDSVEYIGDYAFAGCKQLKEVTVPYSVTHIGEKAFGFTAPDENGTCEKIDGFVITGYENSVAQEYAQLHGFEFVVLKAAQYILGDVDNDKTVSVMDATEIQMVLALMKQWSYADAQKAADFDKDGTVSVMDATEIQLVKAGLK